MTPAQAKTMLAEMGKKLPDMMRRSARSSALRASAKLSKEQPKDNGVLQAAYGPSAVSVYPADKGKTVMLHASAPHAGIIERGARPHPVSAEGRAAIKQWVIRKGIAADAALQPEYKGRDIADIAAIIADLICKKIAAKGQKGNFLVSKTVEPAAAWTRENFERELNALLKAYK
jgi:hypothetical protein